MFASAWPQASSTSFGANERDGTSSLVMRCTSRKKCRCRNPSSVGPVTAIPVATPDTKCDVRVWRMLFVCTSDTVNPHFPFSQAYGWDDVAVYRAHGAECDKCAGVRTSGS